MRDGQRSVGLLAALGASLLLGGCSVDGLSTSAAPPDASPGDMSVALGFPDMAVTPPPPDPCADNPGDPGQHRVAFGPPDAGFALQSDVTPDPLENDNGLVRDLATGYLRIESFHSVFNFVWVPNADDNGGAGTVSKLDSKTVREVARYPSVTCYSLPTGSTAGCDGNKGCCSKDDAARFDARVHKLVEPGHLQVQQGSNHPSRTSVDFNGDLFVANQAPGGQGSVTKIANDPSECVDRNHDGKIETSGDQDKNGLIETDCNGDGLFDDIASVLATPCTNHLAQEYYGIDDECVLWTTNVFGAGARVRALALAAGANDANVSDAWAGAQTTGAFVRVDGASGLMKDSAQLPPECTAHSGPFGATVDAQGIAWVPEEGAGKLCFFDTKKVANVGSVRDPNWGTMQGWGVTLDRDQNVWMGGGVARYTPDRSNGFKNQGNGWWTQITGARGLGITADSRNAKDYFVWSCDAGGGSVLQIPASTLKVKKMDQMVAPGGWSTVTMPCSGVTADADQNLWGFSSTLSTRALVDRKGAITQPVVNGAPMGNNRCPAGDSCQNLGGDVYSDNTGFGIHTGGGRPQAVYSMLIPGCSDGRGGQGPTEWGNLAWDADVPVNTTLIVLAKSGAVPALNDPSWMANPFTSDATASPVCLQTALTPNVTRDGGAGAADGWLYVEFVLKTGVLDASPLLKSFEVTYRCP